MALSLPAALNSFEIFTMNQGFLANRGSSGQSLTQKPLELSFSIPRFNSESKTKHGFSDLSSQLFRKEVWTDVLSDGSNEKIFNDKVLWAPQERMPRLHKLTATLPHHQLRSYQCIPWRQKSKGFKLNRKITHLELQNALDSIEHHRLAFPVVRAALAKDLHSCGHRLRFPLALQPLQVFTLLEAWPGRASLGPRATRCSPVLRASTLLLQNPICR